METSNRHVINVMAALISGTLASRDQLEQKLKTLYHLNIMSKLDDGLLIKNRVNNKLGSKQQQQQQLKDLPTHLRYQKTLNDFVASYLTSSSFGLLHDANMILVNLIRNYLLFNHDELNADLAFPNIPDEKFLKKAISEQLNTWSSIINNISTTTTTTTNGIININQKRIITNDRVVISLNENNNNNNNTTHYFKGGVKDLNNDSVSEDAFSLDIELNKLKMQDQFNGNNNNQLNNNQTTSNDEELNEKNQSILKEEEIYKKTSKVFRPVLSFIGIDAPTGKLIENLFKEMGSFLLGSLKIKKVDINILGKQTNKITNDSTLLNEINRNRINNRNNINKSYSSFNKNNETEQEKVITTILSFDSLLINLSIRKILNETNALNNNNNSTATTNNQFSMVNPVYSTLNNKTIESNDNNNNNKDNKLVKYTAKIDANMKLNNLTQEVNMPLLRLIHQIYSIIADAIDYDKEQQTKFVKNNIQADDTLESNMNQAALNNNNNEATKTPTSFKNKKTLWKDLLEKINEQRYFEKVRLIHSNMGT